MKGIWHRLSLIKKTILIIVGTTTIATFTIIPSLFFTIQEGMIKQQEEHLRGIKNLVMGLIEENYRAIRNYAILFSTDREVKDKLFYHTVLEGERIHPLNAIRHLIKTFNLGFIELCDSSGWVVANTSDPNLYDIDRSGEPVIRTALSGKTATAIKKKGDRLFLMAASPIYYDQGQLIGTITTGIIMDNAFASSIKELSGVDLALVDRKGSIFASTLPAMTPGEQIDLNSEIKEIKGSRYLLMNIPLSVAKAPPAGYMVIMAEDRLPAIIRKAHFTVTAILLTLTLLSVTSAILILKRVLHPIRALKEGAERIGRGDFNHPISVKSQDEIGSLAEVFNRMARNLQRLKEMEERLHHSERLASLGQFTAGVAHELNNPLANILGLLKLIRRNPNLDEDISEDLDIAIREASRCGSIVRDLLLYSRQSPPEKELTNINTLIEGILKSIQNYIRQKDISVRRVYSDKLPPLEVDPLQMEQVIRNLITNAVQAVDNKGEIIVKTEKGEDSFVKIIVSDNGEGIGNEDINRVFYPFFTTKKTGDGTGLGLTVSYGIVQSHGGEITVESTPGRGSTFTVILPANGHRV